MKKTLALLFALCGIAAAETVDLLAAENAANWSFSNTDQITIENGTLKNSGHWNSGWADYKLDTAITLNTNMTLELSYTLTFKNKSDVAATVSLHGSSGVLAFGVKTYNGGKNDAPFCIGYSTGSTAINANAVTFAASNGYGYIFNTYKETGITAGIMNKEDGSAVSHIIKESITWDDISQKFVATIYVDNTVADKQTMGDSFVLNKISVATAGNNNVWQSQPSYSNMQLKVVPEPTTATLSLLALAGLAARRRRK